MCSGKRMYSFAMNEDYICRSLLEGGERLPAHIREAGMNYRQLNLFDDFQMEMPVPAEEGLQNLLGQL